MHAPVYTTRELRCVMCRSAFNFQTGDTAMVLRHVSYGYDFVHDGACLTAATDLMFPEPGYDCAAFGRDPERHRVLSVVPANGWVAILPRTAGGAARREPLQRWVLVEHRDGTASMEGVIRDEAWLDEPGGAEFAADVRGTRAVFEYALPEAGRHQTDWAPAPDDSAIRLAAA